MSGAWSISWLYQPLFSGASPANTTSGRWARTAAGSAVINCVTPVPHVTVATPTSQFFRAYAIAAASAQCSCLTYTMRHPPSDKRAAQFMFASPRSAKHVRTSSCAKALARMSYTRGLASFFIVATPASNWEGPSLFLLDARGVHRVAPQRRFAADPGGKLGRRIAERIDADLVQPLDDARVAGRLRHLVRDAVDDRPRRRGRRENPVPGAAAKTRIKLCDRRQVRKLRCALFARNGEQPDLAALRVLDHVRGISEDHLDLTADEIGYRLRASFVGNVAHFQSGTRSEQRRRKVCRAAGTARGVVELSRMRLRIIDEILERFRRHR